MSARRRGSRDLIHFLSLRWRITSAGLVRLCENGATWKFPRWTQRTAGPRAALSCLSSNSTTCNVQPMDRLSQSVRPYPEEAKTGERSSHTFSRLLCLYDGNCRHSDIHQTLISQINIGASSADVQIEVFVDVLCPDWCARA